MRYPVTVEIRGSNPLRGAKQMLLYISGEMTGFSCREGGSDSLQEYQTMLLYISGEMTGLSSREGGFESPQKYQIKEGLWWP